MAAEEITPLLMKEVPVERARLTMQKVGAMMATSSLLEVKRERGRPSFEPGELGKRRICRVPWCLRGRDNDVDFRPRLVSIGPYHHGDDRLKDMQSHKARMLDCVVKRTRKDKSEFHNVIKVCEGEARACYEDLPEMLFPSEKFVEMLVLDGCFILDFLVGCYKAERLCELGYKEDDPIFSKVYMCYGILMDMILIENQIPLSILDKLYEVQFNHPQSDKVVNLMFKAFNSFWVTGRVPDPEEGEELVRPSLELQNAGCSTCLAAFWQNLTYDCPTSEGNLGSSMLSVTASGEEVAKDKRIGDDVFHHVTALIEASEGQEKAERKRIPNHGIRSVIALKEAGVVFKHKNATTFYDVKFDFKSGVLEIPQIMITESSKSMFLNLMAFELCHIEGTKQRILSYLHFMDGLIDSASDVYELRACEAIVGTGMSDKEIADVFNSLCRHTLMIESCHQELIMHIHKYCSKRIHRWRANLIHNYFYNPWASISVVAAGFLLLLTVLQTCYTILPYYRKP